ncbi:MerB-like organometallic lyase SaoL [Cetobacterium ceti]
MMDLQKYKGLPEEEQKARFLLMEETINRGILSENEGREIILENDFPEEIYDNLKEKEVFVTVDGNIGYIYPVSGFPTHHRVKRADGKEFYAMCAVDALGSYATFYKDLEINSICSETGEEIKIIIKNGKVTKYSPENIHVLHVDLEKFKNWAANC